MKPIFLCLFVVFCFVTVAAESPAPVQEANSHVAYRLKIDGKWVFFDEIVARAEEHIKANDAEFERKTFRCNFWVDPEATDRFMAITFVRGIGQPGHRVYFSRDGKVSGSWSGVMGG
jgi:hypothetical protein